MAKPVYQVGAILKNPLRQYTKIISVKNGVYGISGWQSRENAEKSTIAMKHLNVFGLQFSGVRVVEQADAKTSKKSAKSKPSDEAGEPTKAKKSAKKSTAAKTARGKSTKTKGKARTKPTA